MSLFLAGVLNHQGTTAFSPMPVKASVVGNQSCLYALPEKVEVCGFKDCRRAGGGAKLQNLVKTVLEENDLLDSVVVQDCECQGECGYGPNLLLDGKMVNRVKGKDAVAKALGLAVEQAE